MLGTRGRRSVCVSCRPFLVIYAFTVVVGIPVWCGCVRWEELVGVEV